MITSPHLGFHLVTGMGKKSLTALFIASVLISSLSILSAQAADDYTPKKIATTQRSGKSLTTSTTKIGITPPVVDSDYAINDASLSPCYYFDRSFSAGTTAESRRQVPTFFGGSGANLPDRYQKPAEQMTPAYLSRIDWLSYIEAHLPSKNHADGIVARTKCCWPTNVTFTSSCEFADNARISEVTAVERAAAADTGLVGHQFSCQKKVCGISGVESTCGLVYWTEDHTKGVSCVDPAPADWKEPAAWSVPVSSGVVSSLPATCPPQAHGAKWEALDPTYTAGANPLYNPPPAGECAWGDGNRQYVTEHRRTLQCINGSVHDTGGKNVVTYAIGECAPQPPPCTNVFIPYDGQQDVAGVQVDTNRWRVGTVSDNYWGGWCAIYDRQASFNVPVLDAVAEARLVWVGFDDWTKLEINGQLAYVGPHGGSKLDVVDGYVDYGYGTGSCELSTSWSISPNVDLKPFLKQGRNVMNMRTVVAGGGEGWFDIVLTYKGGYSVCQATNDGYTYKWYSGGFGTCAGGVGATWGGFGACSASCGGGTQTRGCVLGSLGTHSRSVYCQRSDGAQVADAYCASAGTRPATSEACTMAGQCTSGETSSQACNTTACVCPSFAATETVSTSERPYAVGHNAWGRFMNDHAIWIASGGGPDMATNRWIPFLRTFSVGSTGNYTFRLTADNSAQFYLDGELILSSPSSLPAGVSFHHEGPIGAGSQGSTTPFEGYYQITKTLSAGNHTMLMQGWNDDNGSGSWSANPGGVAGAVYDGNWNIIFDSAKANQIVSLSCPSNYTLSGGMCVPVPGLPYSSCARY